MASKLTKCTTVATPQVTVNNVVIPAKPCQGTLVLEVQKDGKEAQRCTICRALYPA
jgi:hypothetical protein